MHEYYLKLIAEINSLRKKVSEMESEIGIFHEKGSGPIILSFSDPRIKADCPDKNLFNKVVYGMTELIPRLEKAEELVNKADDYYQKAEGVDKKVHNEYATAADDALKIAKTEYGAIKESLSKWREYQKKGHSKKGKTKYIHEKHFPLIVEKYKKHMPESKQINVYQTVCEEISKEHDLSISTIQHKAKEGAIKKDISRLKRLERKTEKAIKKKK